MSFLIAEAFEELATESVDVLGGKGHSLVRMTSEGIPVAPGFVVTAHAFADTLSAGTLAADIRGVIAQTDDGLSLAEAATTISRLIGDAGLPSSVSEAVRVAYTQLCQRIGQEDVAVAVRSSATVEDSANASFAGEFETWLDVVGIDSVLSHLTKCYQSMYEDRVLAYMLDRDINPTDVSMAVVVQKTVRARASGVMFTLDPITGDRSSVVVESTWGLGLGVVGGEVVPDRFLVNKITRQVESKLVGSKAIAYLRGDGPPVVLPEEKRAELSLTDDEVVALSQLGTLLEKLHGVPQDIEFAIDDTVGQDSAIVLLQCRPETVWSNRQQKVPFDAEAGVMAWVSQVISHPDQSASPESLGHSHGA